MRSRALSTLVVAVSVLLIAEGGLRLAGARLDEPQYWYAPDAAALVDEMVRVRESGAVVDVILTGSSMVQFGLVPSVLEDSLSTVSDARNAGIPKGYTTVTQRWLLEEVTPRLPPTRVIWGLSSIDFNGGRPTPALAEYEAAPAGALGVFGTLDRGLWRVSAIARYRQQLRDPSFLTDLAETRLGAPAAASVDELMAPTEWPDLRQTERKFLDLTSSLLFDFHIGEAHADAFRSTVVELERQGVQVVIALLPVTQQYIDAHPDGEGGYRRFVDWLRDQASELGVPLFEYDRGIAAERFLDFNHIDEIGARQLTELLATDLAGLGW